MTEPKPGGQELHEILNGMDPKLLEQIRDFATLSLQLREQPYAGPLTLNVGGGLVNKMTWRQSWKRST